MISKIIDLIRKNREFILYGIFGAATAIISFSVFYVCERLLGEDLYLVSNGIAWFCAITFACFTNKFLVFKSKSCAPKVLMKELLLFYSSRIMSFFVEETGLWLLIEIMDFGEFSFEIIGFEITGHLISKGIVGIIAIIMNFLFSKFITFAKKA